MNKINLESLEKYTSGNNKGNIDWIHSIGKYLEFTYQNIHGKLLIKDYNPHNQYVTVEYNDNQIEIFVTNLKKCGIGKLLHIGEYKYNVGDIVDVKTNKFKILSQTRLYGEKNKKQSYLSYLCKCLNCGYEKIIREQSLLRQNGCTKCGDGVSYPEKFVINIFDQLNINIIVQKRFKWAGKKRYDIYIPSNNTIIEVNGGQHYEQLYYSTEDEQENDKIKKQLAIKNGIENYIVIDAKQSSLKYMKQSILKSEINKICNLDKIDWKECDKNSQKSYIKEIYNEWNKENHLDTDELAKKYHRCKDTIQNYLRLGNTLGWCKYNSTENHKNGRKKAEKSYQFNKPVICITTGKEFESQVAATKYYNIYKSGVNDCCRGHIPSAGKDPITGKRLIWRYLN